MASALQISLVVVVVLFAVFNLGTGLNCVSCSGDGDQAGSCKDNTTETKDKLCVAPADHCLKIEVGDGSKTKEKRCGTTTECDDYKNCWACKNDNNCNSSSSVMPSFLLMGILGTIVAKRYI